MHRFRNFLLIIAVVAAALGGIYLLNLINGNNSIGKSSANVYNILALSQVQDNILYTNNIVVDVNAQILSEQNVTSGSIQISYDKNFLEVDDIIMPANIIAVNQKNDTAAGVITLDIKSVNDKGFKDISNFARIVFSKKSDTGKFSSITLLAPSSLGDPNTLDGFDKSLSISW